jgi:hypothetical protein
MKEIIIGITAGAATISIIYILITIMRDITTRNAEKLVSAIKQSIVQSNTALNFEKDCEFVRFLIAYKVEHSVNLIFKPMLLTNEKGFITDKILEERSTEIITDILTLLNPSYINIMEKYFGPGQLQDFIAENVYLQLTVAVADINQVKITRMQRKNKIIVEEAKKEKL